MHYKIGHSKNHEHSKNVWILNARLNPLLPRLWGTSEKIIPLLGIKIKENKRWHV